MAPGTAEETRLYLVGHQEFAALYGVKPPQVSQWLQRKVLTDEEALVVSGVRYWTLRGALEFGPSATRPRHPDMSVALEIAAAQEPAGGSTGLPALEEMARRSDLPPIVGQQEIQQIFGAVPQGTLATAAAAGRLAPPRWRLSGSPLWLLDDVLMSVPDLQSGARSLAWLPDEAVLARLRDGTYDGPGSVVHSRGRRRYAE